MPCGGDEGLLLCMRGVSLVVSVGEWGVAPAARVSQSKRRRRSCEVSREEPHVKDA